MGSTTLITGASGWLGKTLVTHLLKNGSVTTGDLILAGSESRMLEIADCKFTLQALSDLACNPPQVDVIYHFAAVTKDRLQSLGIEKFRLLSDRINFEVRQIVRRTRPRTVVFASSGAAATAASGKISEELDPYGFAKWHEEIELTRECEGYSAIQIYRIWSMTGALINKHHCYAITDFVQQALSGDSIKVSSVRPTWRRYASAEQLTYLMVELSKSQGSFSLDVGGELIEMRDLARRVADLIAPGCLVQHEVDDRATEDRYFSKSHEYEQNLVQLGQSPMNLDDQISVVASAVRRLYEK